MHQNNDSRLCCREGGCFPRLRRILSILAEYGLLCMQLKLDYDEWSKTPDRKAICLNYCPKRKSSQALRSWTPDHFFFSHLLVFIPLFFHSLSRTLGNFFGEYGALRGINIRPLTKKKHRSSIAASIIGSLRESFTRIITNGTIPNPY